MAKAAKRDGAAPEEIRDLRGAIEWMNKEGDIIITEKEVDPNLEITGIQKQLDGSCPILFENVKGKPKNRCITNLFGDMNVINKMFGWKDHADQFCRTDQGAGQRAFEFASHRRCAVGCTRSAVARVQEFREARSDDGATRRAGQAADDHDRRRGGHLTDICGCNR